jgi:hypothetical protein
MSPLVARRTSRTSLLLASMCLLAGFARADEITTNLTGKVMAINGTGNPDAVSQLAALGVHVGSKVTGSITIESTTPGFPVQGPPYDFMQYNDAVTDFSLAAGSWELSFVAPPGFTVDFVTVADDATTPGTKFKFDSWAASAQATDTDLILSDGPLVDYGSSLFNFVQLPPKASKDDGLVQDLAKYTSDRSFAFAGSGGVISIQFDKAGGGGGGTVDPTALARQGELRAAAKLGKSVLKGLGVLAAAGPDKDPLGTKETALLQDSSDTFGIKFVAAVNKALKKGGSAPLDAGDKQAATDYLMQGLTAQADAITKGTDTASKDDRALRGKILKALAAECSADFLAHSKDAKKPDADKLADKLAKSRATLAKLVGKALDQAAKQGVVYEGPGADQLSDDLTTFIDGFVELTQTGVE